MKGSWQEFLMDWLWRVSKSSKAFRLSEKQDVSCSPWSELRWASSPGGSHDFQWSLAWVHLGLSSGGPKEPRGAAAKKTKWLKEIKQSAKLPHAQGM